MAALEVSEMLAQSEGAGNDAVQTAFTQATKHCEISETWT